MSRRRYSKSAPLSVRAKHLLALTAPTSAVVRDVVWEHPEAERIYSEDAADWLTDRELSPTYFSEPDYAVMSAEVNRDCAIDGWFRDMGFRNSYRTRFPLYSARIIGFGMPPLESSVLHLPALHWSARCDERHHALSAVEGGANV